ncbi:MAG: alpha-ribazole phosphatase CobZ [Euryarchaeota archaeon]|nr:alpha-ribazole phosphatase CobZ [Euryarchaeota archaeon]
MKDLEDVLRESGITTGEMVSAYLELFVAHPGIETAQEAEAGFRRELERAMDDVNVCALVAAGLKLEEEAEAGRLPGMDPEAFREDAVHILADEVLGMAIAEYIGGTRARFEYVRYDREKPGILGRLGPFADDVVCGLIAGVSSRLYTEAGMAGGEKKPL